MPLFEGICILRSTNLVNYLGKVSAGTLFENAVFHDLKKCGISDLNKLHRIVDNLGLEDYYIIAKDFSTFPKVILAQDL